MTSRKPEWDKAVAWHKVGKLRLVKDGVPMET